MFCSGWQKLHGMFCPGCQKWHWMFCTWWQKWHKMCCPGWQKWHGVFFQGWQIFVGCFIRAVKKRHRMFCLALTTNNKNKRVWNQCFLHKCFYHMTSRLRPLLYGSRREKTCLQWGANNKVADQPANPRSLISAFVIRFMESIISRLATGEISTPKTGVVASRPILLTLIDQCFQFFEIPTRDNIHQYQWDNL